MHIETFDINSIDSLIKICRYTYPIKMNVLNGIVHPTLDLFASFGFVQEVTLLV